MVRSKTIWIVEKMELHKAEKKDSCSWNQTVNNERWMLKKCLVFLECFSDCKTCISMLTKVNVIRVYRMRNIYILCSPPHHSWKMEFEKSEEIEPMLKIKTFSTYFLLKVTNIAEKSFVCYCHVHRRSSFQKIYIPLDVILSLLYFL